MCMRTKLYSTNSATSSLAWAEMYFALASLISGFDFEPEDLVKERDIDFVGDYFVGGVREDSPGVRVKVRKVD